MIHKNGKKFLASEYYALYRGAQKLLGYPVRKEGGTPSHGAASSNFLQGQGQSSPII